MTDFAGTDAMFSLFDKKNGRIVARYQQVFGIKSLGRAASLPLMMDVKRAGVINSKRPGTS